MAHELERTLVVVSAALACAAPASAAPPFQVAPAPAWVVATGIPDSPPSPDAAGGVEFLLVDDQVRVGDRTAQRYHRTVQRVLSSEGSQGASEFRIDFDPTYQVLTLHAFVVRRGTATIQALRPEDVKVIQREHDLDRQVYDGRLTAVLFLRDVRQGDQVDASWTLSGVNPVFGGRFAQSFSLGWSIPVARQSVRLRWPEGRRLEWRMHGLDLVPTRSASGGEVELLLSRSKAGAIAGESDLPPGQDPFPWLEVTEWASWEEVVQWALPLYRPGAPSPAMARQLASWRALPSEEARARAALRFVQDEVRYLGFELGAGSHQPTAPAQVFERRFGDCKDKSLLLVGLLKALGIEAAPALVNTEELAEIERRLPSPFAFDHAIVRARVDGALRWLEPTRSLERASIEAVVPPPYRLALPLAPGERALTALPEPVASPLEVRSSLRVTSFSQPVQYEVVTRYEGLRALWMRHELSDTPPPKLQAHYLDHYAHDDPGIELAAPLQVDDVPDADRITVTERYRLPPMRQGADRDFTAEAIREHLVLPKTALRKLPLAVRHPIAVVERFRVELPGPPRLGPDRRQVVSEAATLTREARLEGGAYLVDLEYRTLRPRLEPSAVAGHIAKVREMRQVTAYTLSLALRDPAAEPASWSSIGLISLAVLGAGALVIGLMAALNGDLRRWWAALRNRRRRLAFASKFRESPGESPHTPIGVSRAEDAWASARDLRCRCGVPFPTADCALEPVVMGGRPLRVLRATCGRCGDVKRTYFMLQA